MKTERRPDPEEKDLPTPIPYPGDGESDDADDYTIPFPALDPPDDWPDPEPPVSIPERELA